MMNISSSGAALRFGATKLKQDVWLAITSNGDGSYSAVPFKSEKEADRFADAYGERWGEGTPDVDHVDKVYDTAEEYIREIDDEEMLDLLA